MPYDAYGNYIPSKADKRTDVLSYDAIGGVGHLIYHLVRFKEYELDYAPGNVGCLSLLPKRLRAGAIYK